jgi:hypothetical protein
VGYLEIGRLSAGDRQDGGRRQCRNHCTKTHVFLPGNFNVAAKLYDKANCRATGSEKIIRAVKKIGHASKIEKLMYKVQRVTECLSSAHQSALRHRKMNCRNAKNFNVCGKSVALVETLISASLYSGGIHGPGT